MKNRKKLQNTTTVRTILKSLNAMSVARIFRPDLHKLHLLCKLILRIVIKIDATRCQILRLKCTKIVFGWDTAPDPLGELTTLPQSAGRGSAPRAPPFSCLKGTCLGFAVPSLCPWRRLCLRLLCKLHNIWSVDSQDNH